MRADRRPRANNAQIQNNLIAQYQQQIEDHTEQKQNIKRE